MILKPASNCVLLFLSILLLALNAAGWNLPHFECEKYDYTDFYSADLKATVNSNPDLMKNRLKQGWSYFKQNFISSNGLVNNRRLEDGVVAGIDEALSKGQGFGMLLALLNNDQEEFNRIFEAANMFLWSNESKSYFIWLWTDNSHKDGAATDADLDIGLALVFADELQKAGYWKPYNRAGTTYKKRAMEIIRSVRNNMCSIDNYLLPGDNWSSAAIGNLNPGYFATAWMKVFDNYQSEVDFSAVIDNCYKVLQKVPHYNKGQAPDWVDSTGKKASYGGNKPYNGLGMQSAGIMAQWRIAMDALWFGDPRAIAYCENTKLTLTQYSNSNPGLILFQMGLYDDLGRYCENTNTCAEAAMWSCAILGSKNQEYSGKGLNSLVLSKIMGSTPASQMHFGSASDSDQVYMLRQSISMLGFAAITGQFPDVLSDMRDSSCNPLINGPVVIKSPLTLSSKTIDLSKQQEIRITALLDRIAPWKLTLSARTTEKSQTVTGRTDSVQYVFSGSGWFTEETVDVTLEVTGLNPAISDSLLKTSFKITGVNDYPQVEPGSVLILHDLENGSAINALGGSWYSYNDESTSGSSVVEPSETELLVAEGAGFPGYGIKAKFDVDQYAGVGMDILDSGTVDLSMFESITFNYKTDGDITGLLFMLATSNITNFAFNQKSIEASREWKEETVLISDLKPPFWSPSSVMDLTVSEKIQWQVQGVGQNGTLYIDNVRMKLKEGALPGNDVLLPYTPVRKSMITAVKLQRVNVCQIKNSLIIDDEGWNIFTLDVFTLSGKRVMRHHFAHDNRPGRKVISSGSINLPAGNYIAVLYGRNKVRLSRGFMWK